MTGPVAAFVFGDAERDDAEHAVRTGLVEDLRYGPDATSTATVPEGARAVATVGARGPGVIAGIEVIELTLAALLEPGSFTVTVHAPDGSAVDRGDVVATIDAPTAGLLTAERTFLNLLCHLSGIASATAEWVAEVAGSGAAIRDSRKTLPGLRLLQKYAVRAGGGVNHRFGLGDEALIKDNHVVAAGSVGAALTAVRTAFPELPVEVEVDTLEQLDEVLALEAELVLLDNMPLWMTQMAVQRRNAKSPGTRLESSGGLTLEVASDYARTGVDFLAVGALTHSVGVLDLGLDFG